MIEPTDHKKLIRITVLDVHENIAFASEFYVSEHADTRVLAQVGSKAIIQEGRK